jgi:hypothetical protein
MKTTPTVCLLSKGGRRRFLPIVFFGSGQVVSGYDRMLAKNPVQAKHQKNNQSARQRESIKNHSKPQAKLRSSLSFQFRLNFHFLYQKNKNKAGKRGS